MDGDEGKSGVTTVPGGTGMAGPQAASHADGGDRAWPGTPLDAQPPQRTGVADAPADEFDSAGRADFLRRMQGQWGSASYADRQTARELLYDSGYDVGEPKVADRNGKLARHPHLPLLNGESNPAQDRVTLQAIGDYLDNERQRPGVNADRFTAIHDPRKILDDPKRPWPDAKVQQALSGLDPRVQALAKLHFEAMRDAGMRVRVTKDQGNRTYQRQDELYAQGRTAPGKIVTHARGGQSNHNFGLAYDVTQLDGEGQPIDDGSDPAYATAARLGKQSGLEWGGDWSPGRKDMPHYQFTRKAPRAELQARHDQHLDPLPQTD